MCRTKEDKSEKERFVDSAIRKKLRNKRKRDPDMRVEAVLECTVRRLYTEILGFHSCLSPSPKRRKVNQDCVNKEYFSDKRTEYKGEVRSSQGRKIISNFEDSATIKLKPRTPASKPAELAPKDGERIVKPSEEISNSVHKNNEKEDEIDFETLLQSISELADATSVSSEDMDVDINELLQELACEPTNSSCKDEDIFNNNDPFLPGMFEILCS